MHLKSPRGGRATDNKEKIPQLTPAQRRAAKAKLKALINDTSKKVYVPPTPWARRNTEIKSVGES